MGDLIDFNVFLEKKQEKEEAANFLIEFATLFVKRFEETLPGL